MAGGCPRSRARPLPRPLRAAAALPYPAVPVARRGRLRRGAGAVLPVNKSEQVGTQGRKGRLQWGRKLPELLSAGTEV